MTKRKAQIELDDSIHFSGNNPLNLSNNINLYDANTTQNSNQTQITPTKSRRTDFTNSSSLSNTQNTQNTNSQSILTEKRKKISNNFSDLSQLGDFNRNSSNETTFGVLKKIYIFPHFSCL